MRRNWPLAAALVALVVVLIGGGILLVNLLGGPGSSGAETARSGYRFTVERNPFGDRVLLTAPVGISYITQPTAPDNVVITTTEGKLQGQFRWTVIPNQGGVRRMLGEFDVNGRVYKVCEFVDNADQHTGGGAERYDVINNAGPKYRPPQRIDPAPFAALFAAAVAQQPAPQAAGERSQAAPASQSLADQAGSLIDACIGQRPGTQRR